MLITFFFNVFFVLYFNLYLDLNPSNALLCLQGAELATDYNQYKGASAPREFGCGLFHG
jgi:hypothetical protein